MTFSDYRKVHNRHYYNSEKNEVIIVDNNDAIKWLACSKY